jgi:Tfp pilus assembly protein PilF
MGDNLEIGLAFLEKGDYKKAITFLTNYIEDNLDDSEAYENRAVAYYHLKEEDASLSD